ncbi:unnamed protein product [Oikopleura dioica]|uniref:Uncharacterized protein n=1 Tax=Oikopleura dioica TaxID=34765 RepID=E4YQ03_OIKDI|nr:unnamed protein product [Oikopleura dioica]
MLPHVFIALFLVDPLLAKKQTIKCKSCYLGTNDAALKTFEDFDSTSNLEENAKNAENACDDKNNDKPDKCEKVAGCLMIKNKWGDIVEYGCVKEWDQKKKNSINIEDSGYNDPTKKALATFDSCILKAPKSGQCRNSDFESFDVSDLLTGPSSSERGDFVNNLFKCGENYCYICDNDDCHYTKEILEANFEQWYKDKHESEKVTTTTTTLPKTTPTMSMVVESTTLNSTALEPLASFATLSIALLFFP